MTYLKCGALALLGPILLGACVETPQTTEAPEKEVVTSESVTVAAQPASVKPAKVASAGDTKLVFYRTSFYGFAIQPKIFVDGKEVTLCVPGRATTLKVNPGSHRVTAKTLSEKELIVSVPKGGTAYVRCSIGVGVVVGGAKLVSVPPQEAAPKANKLKQSAAN